MGSRLAAALSVALLVAPALRAQVVASGVPVAGPGGTQCVDLGTRRVCRTPTGDGATVTVREGAAERVRYTTGPSSGIDLRAFAAGDLLVVATLDAVSNGLDVSTWTVAAIPRGACAPAYSFSAEAFSPTGGSFAAWRGQTVLWATEWTGMADPAG